MLTHLYRQRRYSLNSQWRSWYEKCPIVRVTARYFIIESVDYPESPLYPGGKFWIDRRIVVEEKAYHSRHGEWFYLEPQEDAFLFPSQDILSIPDYVTVEAQEIGWDTTKPIYEWEKWQRQCWFCATMLKISLREAIDRWKFSGESAFDEALKYLHEQNQNFLSELLKQNDH